MSGALVALLKQAPKAEMAVSCINKVYDGAFERHRFKTITAADFSWRTWRASTAPKRPSSKYA